MCENCANYKVRESRLVVGFVLRDVNKLIGVAADTPPAALRPFFLSNEELVRRFEAVAAAVRG